MDIDKIKTGRLKPRFIIAMEWAVLGTLTLVVLAYLATLFALGGSDALGLLSFILLIEFGVLAVLYGAEGLKYQLIWVTYPSLSGPRRIGFSRNTAILVSGLYVLLGLFLLLLSIFSAYSSGKPAV